MVHLILTGATGLVGSGVLQNMLTMESVSRISILSRRPVAMAEGHEKAKVIIHKDFKTYDDALLAQLKDAQGCVWAQGISANDVNKTQYEEITFDYPTAAAKAFSTLHPETPFVFVHVSGEGATTTPSMFSPLFARVKGQAEQFMLDLNKSNPNFRPYNVRPGGVDYREHKEIHEYIAPQKFRLKAVLAVLGSFKSILSPTRPMGRIMTELAMSKGERLSGSGIEQDGRLVRNSGLHRLASESHTEL